MGKTSTKLAVYALVQLLLFHLSGLDAAADFYFRLRADACNGTSIVFRNLRPYLCARTVDYEAGSIEVDIMANTVVSFYGGGECTALKFKRYGSRCVLGGGYTGVLWIPAPILADAAPLLADAAEEGCDTQAKPTGIAYSEESTDGRWILTTDNATEMYTQMDTIPDAQKVDWLQAHGATFKPGL